MFGRNVMPLFGGKHKTPHELVKLVRDGIVLIDTKDEKKMQKGLEDVSRSLLSMKTMLCSSSTNDNDPLTESISQLSQELYSNNTIQLLIDSLSKIDFESRKDVVLIFNNLLRRQIGSRYPTVEHICQHHETLKALMTGYKNHDIALNCGQMFGNVFGTKSWRAVSCILMTSICSSNTLKCRLSISRRTHSPL
jgi:calcium binding protein 39